MYYDAGYNDNYLYNDVGALGYQDYPVDVGGEYYDNSYVDGGYEDYLYDDMQYLDNEVPLVDAWGSYDSGWDQDQYSLGDLIYWQQQLEADRSLDEQERLLRWQNRLAWEESDDSQRRLRWAEMDQYERERLGIAGGYWGRTYGGRNDIDLSYLRNVQLNRGLFSPSFRHVFSRFSGLRSRFSPWIQRDHIRGYGGLPNTFGGGYGGGFTRPVVGAGYGGGVPYRSPQLSNPAWNLRTSELRMRLRMAETRASLTGLPAAARAQALEDARRIRAEINQELRLSRDIDAAQASADAMANANERIQRQADFQRDLDVDRANLRLEAAAADVAQTQSAGLYGGYGSSLGVGGYGGYGVGLAGRRRSFGGYGAY